MPHCKRCSINIHYAEPGNRAPGNWGIPFWRPALLPLPLETSVTKTRWFSDSLLRREASRISGPRSLHLRPMMGFKRPTNPWHCVKIPFRYTHVFQREAKLESMPQLSWGPVRWNDFYPVTNGGQWAELGQHTDLSSSFLSWDLLLLIDGPPCGIVYANDKVSEHCISAAQKDGQMAL